jgi:long-chain acyl-CoA synthetase
MKDEGEDFEPEACQPDNCPIFSYTSGTTGDTKGVKLTHKNLICSALCLTPIIKTTNEDIMVSYLPYPHSFEQVMTTYMLMSGSKIGYYSGDPLRLMEDCQLL